MAAARDGSASCAEMVNKVLSSGAAALTRLGELVRCRAKPELLDHGVETRPGRSHARVRCRQPLRHEQLVVVGARSRQGLADDEGRLGIVDLGQPSAHEERGSCRRARCSRQGAGATPERSRTGDAGPRFSLSALERPGRWLRQGMRRSSFLAPGSVNSTYLPRPVGC